LRFSLAFLRLQLAQIKHVRSFYAVVLRPPAIEGYSGMWRRSVASLTGESKNLKYRRRYFFRCVLSKVFQLN
jgi:hypothetical protein